MKGTVSWQDVLSLIDGLTGEEALTLDDLAGIPGARIERKGTNRYRVEGFSDTFQSMVIVTNGQRNVTLVIVEIVDDDGDLASEVKRLGEPLDLDIVSPPILGEGGVPAWRGKYSVCHNMNGKKVWFGIEEYEEGERLVSVSLEFAPSGP